MENSNTPTLHYVYAHISLRNFVFVKWDVFQKIFEAGPNNMMDFLRDCWTHVKDTNPELRENEIEVSDNDFEVSLAKLGNGQDLLLAKLPMPLNPPEAFYIGILVSENPRYFTLELEYSLFNNNEEEFIVCEWDKDGSHHNYGQIPQMLPGVFAGRIDEIVCAKN